MSFHVWPPQNCTVENSIFQEKARRVIEAPGGRVSESRARRTCIFCPRLRRWQTGAAPDGREEEARPSLQIPRSGQSRGSPPRTWLSAMWSPAIFRTPESPPGQGEGLGSDPGSLNSPAAGCVKGSEEREVRHHSGSAGTASSGSVHLGASDS